MAEVKEIQTHEVTKSIPVQEVTGLLIHLNIDEAKVLYDLCISTGGDPNLSSRKFTDAISRSLERADRKIFYPSRPSDLVSEPRFKTSSNSTFIIEIETSFDGWVQSKHFNSFYDTREQAEEAVRRGAFLFQQNYRVTEVKP